MLSLSEALTRRILFVQGKGGVGKSLVSEAIAQILTERKPSIPVLLVQIDDPKEPRVDVNPHPFGYFTLNATVNEAFLEYAGLKLNSPKLARFLLDHKLVTYLVEAAPGIKELALIGKIWYETRNFSTVIVDMPSTGHALTLFQAFRNWADLFENSPIAKDASQIEANFSDPEFAAHLLMALPEEMPLTESEELRLALSKLYPNFSSAFLVNRVTPGTAPVRKTEGDAITVIPPYSKSATEHFNRRRELEREHLKSVEKYSPLKIPNFLPIGNLVEAMKRELLAGMQVEK